MRVRPSSSGEAYPEHVNGPHPEHSQEANFNLLRGVRVPEFEWATKTVNDSGIRFPR